MERLGASKTYTATVRGLAGRHLWRRLGFVLMAAIAFPIATLGVRGDFGAAPDMRWFAGCLFLMGAVGLVVPALEMRYALRRPGPRQRPAPSGRPSRAYAFSRFFLLFQLVMVAASGVVGVGFGWTVLTSPDRQLDLPWVFGVPVLLLGLWMLSLLVPWLIGRVRVGGVFLTATGIEYQRGSVWWEVDWNDVSVMRAVEPCVLVLKEGADARLRMGRTIRWGWAIGFRKLRDYLEFECRFLATHPGELADTVAGCLADPAVRAGIGDPHGTWR